MIPARYPRTFHYEENARLPLETIDVLLVIWDIGNRFCERHGVMKSVSM
jgi:hypothetical protein